MTRRPRGADKAGKMLIFGAMAAKDVLTLTPAGLYCVPGDFHIDPTRKVAARPDHAWPFRPCAPRPWRRDGDARDAGHHGAALRRGLSPGRGRSPCLASESGSATRWSASIPAGHVLGSAQIAIAAKGTRIVVSGDYKRARDPTCRAFEPVACDLFITEATFGLPVFRHPDVAPRNRQAARLGRAVSRARPSRRRLYARQGAAHRRADPRRRLGQADLYPRRARKAHGFLRERRHRARRNPSRSPAPTAASSAARSSSRRRARSPICGRANSPIR